MAHIYLASPHMSAEGYEQQYIKEAFDTNWVVPLSPNVNGFEDDLKAFVSKNSDGSELSREVVALSAGTAAVQNGNSTPDGYAGGCGRRSRILSYRLLHRYSVHRIL